MIKDGFIYISVLILIAALLINAPGWLKGKGFQTFFKFAPPVVLIYLAMMVCCTFRLWDLKATADIYGSLKNPLLYAMIFLMLLRCDLRKIIRLGPKMLLGFFAATFSIGLGFVLSYAAMHGLLGKEAWRSLAALCGSWMGGGGNMLAIQAALDVDEGAMAYALVLDSFVATIYVMFLLWVIGFSQKFNSWTKSDTRAIDEVGKSLEKEAEQKKGHITFRSIIMLLGLGFTAAAVCQALGTVINGWLPFFDKTTWTVLIITLLGVLGALTPIGRISGTEELSNVLLYIVIALIASRADLSVLENAPVWILCGFMILIIHLLFMIVFAKIFRLDIFTCAVASLANIGGTATAPVLAGTYNSALVPVGIIMALLGYVVGTGGGLLVGQIMSFFG